MSNVIEWLRQHNAIDSVGVLFLLAYGLLAVVRPGVVIGWVQSAFSDRELERTPSVANWTRGIGMFLIAFSLVAALMIYVGRQRT